MEFSAKHLVIGLSEYLQGGRSDAYMRSLFSNMSRVEPTHVGAILADFAACAIHTPVLRLALARAEFNSSLYSHFVSFALTLCVSPLGVRWIRERPSEVGPIFTELSLYLLANVPPPGSHDDDQSYLFSKTLGNKAALATVIINLPADFVLPSEVVSWVNSELSNLVPFINTWLRDCDRQTMSVQNLVMQHNLRALAEYLYSVSSLKQCQEEILKFMPAALAYWDACAASSAADATACTAPPEGEEMMTCARCKSVRYCSKAHQKAHWKDHKLKCVKPDWSDD